MKDWNMENVSKLIKTVCSVVGVPSKALYHHGTPSKDPKVTRSRRLCWRVMQHLYTDLNATALAEIFNLKRNSVSAGLILIESELRMGNQELRRQILEVCELLKIEIKLPEAGSRVVKSKEDEETARDRPLPANWTARRDSTWQRAEVVPVARDGKWRKRKRRVIEGGDPLEPYRMAMFA